MKKIKIFLLAAMLIGVAGCKDFLNVNHDPNNPDVPNIRYLLPGIEASIGSIFTLDFESVGYSTAVFTHQLTSRQPDEDNYGITGSAYVENYWDDFYSVFNNSHGVLQNVELLISLGTTSKNFQYAGIGKVLKAYTFSTMVDLWGNIPYSQANVKGNLDPAFDTDQDIYASLFNLIDEGIADMKKDSADINLLTPTGDDLIYGGKIDSWIRMANTLKLKLYTQVKDVPSMYDQAKVDALLANGPDSLISTWAQSFNIPYGKQSSPDDRNPAFVTEYGGGQISNYISPWLFNIMMGNNDHILTGITDPRIPYYWVNQLNASKSPENKVEFRDGNFVSIYFGSTGPNRDAAGRATFSMMGIYPCGGRYDDGKGSTSTAGFSTSDATGAAPCRLITYADRYYLEAELLASGKATSPNALKDVFDLALKASFNQVNQVAIGAAHVSQTVPTITSTVRDAYISAIDTLFTVASADRQMELIMTEKWLSSFGTSHDQYTDYRRTGYPVLFDPNDPNSTDTGIAGQMSGGPDGNGIVPVQRTRDYPVSWPYFNDELTLNKNAPAQKANITSEKIFWDK